MANASEREEKARRVHRLLLADYGTSLGRPQRDPLSELIETVLSQHTSDANSVRAFEQLRAAFPSWEMMRDAPVERVAEAIRSAGLANIKAPRLQEILRTISQRYGGLNLDFLARMPLPEAKAALRALPGVGPKTAACVLLFALGRPAFPVDTHVYRVSQRLGLIDHRTTADQAHEILEQLVPAEAVYTFHMNLIAHGRRVCRAQRPRCEACTLREECTFWRERRGASPYPATPS